MKVLQKTTRFQHYNDIILPQVMFTYLLSKKEANQLFLSTNKCG